MSNIFPENTWAIDERLFSPLVEYARRGAFDLVHDQIELLIQIIKTQIEVFGRDYPTYCEDATDARYLLAACHNSTAKPFYEALERAYLIKDKLPIEPGEPDPESGLLSEIELLGAKIKECLLQKNLIEKIELEKEKNELEERLSGIGKAGGEATAQRKKDRINKLIEEINKIRKPDANGIITINKKEWHKALMTCNGGVMPTFPTIKGYKEELKNIKIAHEK